MKALFVLLAGLFMVASAQAETVAGYKFSDYPAQIYKGKKAPLQLGDWRSFRTRLKWAHDDGEIAFAGSYMVSIWGCGTGCISGAMIDKKTGKVYGLPIGEGSPYDNCYSSDEDNEDKRLTFYPNSRLFITRDCEQEAISDTKAKQKITYAVNVWNEKSKSFKLIKEVKETKTVNTDF